MKISKLFLQINSKSPPLDSESDSFFQSLQQKNNSVVDQTLTAEQLITDFGQTKNRILQQEELVKSGRSSSITEKTKLALRMFEACFNTATFSLLLDVADSSVARHQEITDLKILSLEGRIIKKLRPVEYINVSFLNKGIYFLKVNDHFIKFIKK